MSNGFALSGRALRPGTGRGPRKAKKEIVTIRRLSRLLTLTKKSLKKMEKERDQWRDTVFCVLRGLGWD